MFINDHIEKITLQEQLKNVEELLKTVQDENAKLNAAIDLYCRADAEKTDKIKRLSEEVEVLKRANLVMQKDSIGWKVHLDKNDKDDKEDKIKKLEARIDVLENDRSDLLVIHTADVETINKLNIQARDLNSTISTLLGRVSKYEEEKQELNKKVQDLKDIIKDLSEKLYK